MDVGWKHVVNATIPIKYHVNHVLNNYVLKRLQKKNFARIVNTQGQEEYNDRLGRDSIKCYESNR